MSLYINDMTLSQSVAKPLITGFVIFFVALGLVLSVLSFALLKDTSYKQKFIQAAWIAFVFVIIAHAALYLLTSSIFYLDGAFYLSFAILFAFLAGVAVKGIWPSIFRLSDENQPMQNQKTDTNV